MERVSGRPLESGKLPRACRHLSESATPCSNGQPCLHHHSGAHVTPTLGERLNLLSHPTSSARRPFVSDDRCVAGEETPGGARIETHISICLRITEARESCACITGPCVPSASTPSGPLAPSRAQVIVPPPPPTSTAARTNQLQPQLLPRSSRRREPSRSRNSSTDLPPGSPTNSSVRSRRAIEGACPVARRARCGSRRVDHSVCPAPAITYHVGRGACRSDVQGRRKESVAGDYHSPRARSEFAETRPSRAQVRLVAARAHETQFPLAAAAGGNAAKPKPAFATSGPVSAQSRG